MSAHLIAASRTSQFNLRQDTRFWRATSMFVGIGLLMLVLMASLPARAADHKGDDTTPALNDDQIVLTLAMEDHITTKNPLVHVSIDAAFQDAQQGKVRSEVMAALKKLDSKADWRLTNFNRRTDRSGLVQWTVNAEARMDADGLSGFEERAKKSSRGGFAIRLNNVNWTPTLAEREAGMRALRGQLYKAAMAERDMVNDAFGPRAFRIGLIDFVGTGPLVQQTRAPKAEAGMMRAMAADASFAPQTGFSVSEKLRLKATVVLIANPVVNK